MAAPGNRNLLLATLPSVDRRRLTARCELVELISGAVLCEPGDRIRHVHFPIQGFISLVASMDDGSSIEAGLVGAEGALGISLMLGVEAAPLREIVRGPGSALRLPAAQFAQELSQNSALGNILKRYLYVSTRQLAQLAACSHFHLIEARLARWLLMTRDRASSDQFHLTQQTIASLLGVRRAGITQAANALRVRKLIRYKRGAVTILDSRGLEAISCECYATAGRWYSRFMR